MRSLAIRSGTAHAVLLFALSAASVARADAIGPPADCPPGTRSVVDHAGARCATWACDDGRCADGLRCTARRVCIVRASVTPGGWSPPGTPPVSEDQTVAVCLPSEECDGTEPGAVVVVGAPLGPPTCALADVCLRSDPSAPLPLHPPSEARATEAAAASAPAEPPPSGCASGPGRAGAFLATALVAFAVAGRAITVARARAATRRRRSARTR
jgi:hypothetical protein